MNRSHNRERTTSRITRRRFLATSAAAGAFCSLAPLHAQAASPTDPPDERPAEYWDIMPGASVKCRICPWECTVPPGKRGICNVRENRDGTFFTLVHSRPSTVHNDPIEKKPFFHVYPGSKAFSIATVGCNFDCKFCQNWEIARAKPEEVPARHLPPEQVVELARRANARAVAFTYNEPTVFFEYMRDCARIARSAGLAGVVVSNGFICDKPLRELCTHVQAIKIDLKSFTQKFYTDYCAGQLQPVLDSIKTIKETGVWLELVILTIPTLNDNLDDIKRMAEWVVAHVGPAVPLHFTRFHPEYKLRNLPPTPTETLIAARQAAMDQGCQFVYSGNLPGIQGENTECPACHKNVINRYGHSVIANNVVKGKCRFCNQAIPGLWESA